MTIKLVKKEDGCTLYLEGRLDTLTAPETEEIFRKVQEQYSKVTLDLENLEYVSSAGLRVLKLLHIQMRDKGGRLYFRNTQKNVYEVFELTGFVGLFEFLPAGRD